MLRALPRMRQRVVPADTDAPSGSQQTKANPGVDAMEDRAKRLASAHHDGTTSNCVGVGKGIGSNRGVGGDISTCEVFLQRQIDEGLVDNGQQHEREGTRATVVGKVGSNDCGWSSAVVPSFFGGARVVCNTSAGSARFFRQHVPLSPLGQQKFWPSRVAKHPSKPRHEDIHRARDRVGRVPPHLHQQLLT